VQQQTLYAIVCHRHCFSVKLWVCQRLQGVELFGLVVANRLPDALRQVFFGTSGWEWQWYYWQALWEVRLCFGIGATGKLFKNWQAV
jgi:hypothetical protein